LPSKRLVDPNIQPTELEKLLDEPASDVQLLDIREPWEWSLCHIGKPQFLQMGELERQLDSVDKRRDLIVYCHHGTRSGVAVDWLRARGFPARNLVGGIDRWSREIDSSVPRY
jgi:adenylyltransferase/sulfurtransferase